MTAQLATDVVTAFEHATSTADPDAAAALVTADVEIGGPPGVTHGVDLLREWVSRVGIRLTHTRLYGASTVVVAEQRARWPADPAEHLIGMLFEFRDGLLCRVVRYDDLASALAAAGLTEDDPLR